MIAWAAVDVLEGRAVRLRQGRRETATDYGEALEAVARWAEAGLRALHLVDLGAAFGGAPSLAPLLRSASGRWPKLALQAGGGIGSAGDALRLAEAGASRVVAGSLLFRDRAEARRLASALGPGRSVAALDVRAGRVKVSGWRADAGAGLHEAMAMAVEMGYGEVLVTDIERDGVMAGPNLELYGELPEGAACIASGGVRDAQDLQHLAALPGVAGAIVGRALYEGTVRPSELAEYQP